MTARERKALARAIYHAANDEGTVQAYDGTQLGLRYAPNRPEWHCTQSAETLAQRLGVSREYEEIAS